MAGPVKGEWDGKPIELNDAATETTLLKILDAMKKNGGGAGGVGGASKEASKKVEEMGKQADLAADSIEEMEDAASGFADGLKGALGNIKDAFFGLAEEFLIGGDSLSDFSKHFANLANEIPIIGGVLGGTLQTLTGILDSQIDNYRQLSNSGIVFGSSLFDAQRAAANTNLTLDQFSQVVTNNSATLAQLGGTAGAGAKVFTNVSRIMRQDFGTQFQTLGMQAAEQAEMTANYLGILQRTGRLQNMTAEQQSASAGKYIMQVDRLAKATGAQREQIEADMAAAALDDRMANIMLTMGEDAQREMTATLAYIKQTLGPEAEAAFMDVIVTGGAPMTEMGESLMLNNAELANMAIAVRNGERTAADFDTAMVAARDEVMAQGDTQARFRATMAATGDTTFAFTNQLIKSGRTAASLTEAQQEQQDQINRGSEGLLGFGTRLTELRNQIIGKLIDSGIFEKLETVFNDVVSYFTTGGGFDAMTSAIDGFSTWFSQLFNDMKEAESPMDFIIDKIKSWWKDVDIKGMIWNAIFGGGEESASSSEPRVDPGTIDEFGDNRNPDYVAGGDTSTDTGGFFDGLSEKLGTFGSILAVGGAVYAAVAGFQALLAGFGTGPVAVGAAVFTGMLIGTGAAILAAGVGIDKAGDGVNKIAAGVERLAAVRDAANLAVIADSLGKLGPALISLTAGGVMDAITSFFGADSPFDKLVEGINKFANVDQTAVATMNTAGTALQAFTGLTDDLDSSKIEQYADAIEDLAEAMKELNKQLAEDNAGVFGSGTGVSAGSLLSSGQMTLGGSGSGSSDQLERLNTTMENILTAINDTSRREVQAISGLGNSVY